MKKFTKISLIIAAILGGLGILFCGISAMTGGGYGMIHQMARNGELKWGKWHITGSGIEHGDDDDWKFNMDISLDDDDTEYSINESTGKWISDDELVYEYAVSDVKDLDLDISAAWISFVEGTKTDAIVVRLEDCKEKYYQGGISGNTLKIKYDQEAEFNSTDEHIIIEIPEGLDFQKINFEIGATNAEFALKDVSCETLLLDVGAGNIVADEFNVKEYMEISAGVGNVEINGGTYRDINLECGMGNFTVEGTIEGDLVAECGMGSMDLQLKGNPDAYNYDLECGMGELSVNGTQYSSIAGSHKVTNAGAIGTISLSCGMGSLDLNIR